MTLCDVTPSFLETLKTQLPAAAFRDVTLNYLEEPRGRWAGRAGAVVAPGATQEVSTVLKAANAAKVPVVPYGGGTGLVAGQVVTDGPLPLILSLERMTAIRAIYPSENVIVVEAGAILEEVHTAAEGADRLFPMSIAAKGSARIGGCMATNAGGVNVLRYGNTRDLTLGIEAVTADGQIYNGLTRLRKDNTGYDLRNLLVGSEGTLGVITAAALKLAPRSVGEGTALMVVESPQAALDLLSLARAQVAEGISAFELMHRTGLSFLKETMPDVRQPFAAIPQWLVLIDLGLGEGQSPQEALETLFAEAFERGLVTDGMIAQSEQQRADFWSVRETIPDANRRIGSISSHDISLPLSCVPEFITTATAALGALGDMRINCFGHLGDGNLHFNVFPAQGQSRDAYADLRHDIQRTTHDLVMQMEGSFSAEHGVGRLKVADLQRYGDPTKLAMMQAIKTALDPNGIMNPGAVLPMGG